MLFCGNGSGGEFLDTPAGGKCHGGPLRILQKMVVQRRGPP